MGVSTLIIGVFIAASLGLSWVSGDKEQERLHERVVLELFPVFLEIPDRLVALRVEPVPELPVVLLFVSAAEIARDQAGTTK